MEQLGQEMRVAGGVSWRGVGDQGRPRWLGPQVKSGVLGKGWCFSNKGWALGRGLGGAAKRWHLGGESWLRGRGLAWILF